MTTAGGVTWRPPLLVSFIFRLCNDVSGPLVGLPGPILAGLRPGKTELGPPAGLRPSATSFGLGSL